MVRAQYCCWCHQVCVICYFKLFKLSDISCYRALVRAFPESGLGVSVATDGVLFQSDVFQASYSSRQRYHHGKVPAQWGDRPVLLLLGIRLGLDGVNPIYYDTIKVCSLFRPRFRY